MNVRARVSGDVLSRYILQCPLCKEGLCELLEVLELPSHSLLVVALFREMSSCDSKILLS